MLNCAFIEAEMLARWLEAIQGLLRRTQPRFMKIYFL